MSRTGSLLAGIAISIAGCASINKNTVLSTRTQSVGIWGGDNGFGIGYGSIESHIIPAQPEGEPTSFISNIGSSETLHFVAVGQAANLITRELAEQSSSLTTGARYSVFKLDSDSYVIDNATGTIYLISGDNKHGLDLSREIGKIGRKQHP